MYDFGSSVDGSFYYVMELLDGLDLEQLVKRYGPQPSERVAAIMLQACHSLSEAHEAGLVHRDIKPSNLFLCRYGRDVDFVKLLDFGIVKQVAAEQDGALTAENVALGTPAFVAPEAVLAKPIDARADLYALGCVAFWLLCGRNVFEANAVLVLLVAHAHQPAPRPLDVSALPIPPVLDAIVARLLQKSPERRFQSAEELANALRESGLVAAWTRERGLEWWDEAAPSLAAPPIETESMTQHRLLMTTIAHDALVPEGDARARQGPAR